MRPVLPGGKSISANRVPLAGGAVPRMRAPRSSIVSPTEISAGGPSRDQIRVDTVPGEDDFQLVAAPSVSTLATWRASCPVTTRRIGGYSGLAWFMTERPPVLLELTPMPVFYRHARGR